MLAFLTRRKDTTPVDTAETIEQPTGQMATSNIAMQFLTQGGARVEIRNHRFSTRYLPTGRPYVGDEAHDVDGFTWKCLGCDADGKTDGNRAVFWDYGRYLPGERDDARRDANQHADKCRAMPKPTA
jgi:hypothetical protein